ncbi:MAG: YhjD/YihY/BrkB family envelope integrity protein [Chloroflexota bacterium]
MTEPTPGSAAPAEGAPPKKGRLKRTLMPIAMRFSLLRRVIGIQVVYRSVGGGLIVGGLAYAALFALIPTLVLVIAGITWLIDDPQFRQQAVDLLSDAFPAISGITDTAVKEARELVAVGGIIALVGFAWGASGLYLNLTRAMERFFPGERVSGALARVLGVLLVVLIIVGVLAAVIMAGVVTVIAEALNLDVEWILRVATVAATLALASGIVYAIYRVIPANPPEAWSARLPALLVGVAIALMTLLYSVLSPWLVSGFQVFGVAATVFVALVWLRVVFLAMVYGAAMARYRDYVFAARLLGEATPDAEATQHAIEEEERRAAREMEASAEVERRKQEAVAHAAEAEAPSSDKPG